MFAYRYQPPKTDPLAALHALIPEAVQKVAEAVLDAADPNVPVEYDVMRRSGRVVPDGSTAYITYGRDDDGYKGHAASNQYVLKQHENTELHHPRGGHAKWLELAMAAVKDRGATAALTVLRRVF